LTCSLTLANESVSFLEGYRRSIVTRERDIAL
jgi:hypothetical protein